MNGYITITGIAGLARNAWIIDPDWPSLGLRVNHNPRIPPVGTAALDYTEHRDIHVTAFLPTDPWLIDATVKHLHACPYLSLIGRATPDGIAILGVSLVDKPADTPADPRHRWQIEGPATGEVLDKLRTLRERDTL